MLPRIYLGSTGISVYWLMVAVGAVSMLICLLKRRGRFTLSSLQTVGFNFLLTVTGIVGAMLLYTLENLSNGFKVGGTSFFGSVYLVPLLMALLGKLFHLHSSQIWDLCAPCVVLMVGCIRVGCFLNGCCGGICVNLNGFSFCWPTQILESVGDFGIAALLLQLENKSCHTGKLYPILMLLYSVMRFFIEFLRDTPKNWLFMSHGQWFSLASILVGVIWLLRIKGEKCIQ